MCSEQRAVGKDRSFITVSLHSYFKPHLLTLQCYVAQVCEMHRHLLSNLLSLLHWQPCNRSIEAVSCSLRTLHFAKYAPIFWSACIAIQRYSDTDWPTVSNRPTQSYTPAPPFINLVVSWRNAERQEKLRAFVASDSTKAVRVARSIQDVSRL